jgi:hypothetical protein
MKYIIRVVVHESRLHGLKNDVLGTRGSTIRSQVWEADVAARFGQSRNGLAQLASRMSISSRCDTSNEFSRVLARSASTRRLR